MSNITKQAGNGELIAVSNAMAGELAGASTWWQLSGVVDAYAFRQAGRSMGIAEENLPGDTTPKTAIRRACVGETSKRLMARSLSSGAWAMVREVEVPNQGMKAADLEHKVVLTCRVDNASQTLVFSGPEEHGTLRQAIEASYKIHLAQLDATDLSSWLVFTADRIRAVALRDRGGVYFIPRGALGEWRQVAAVLKSTCAGCDVFELPTLRSDEAVRSIVAAVTREAQAQADELQEKINNGEIGKLAMRRRAADCDALCRKLEEYENLLGTSLDSVKAHVQATGAASMTAALLASAEDDSAESPSQAA